MDSFTPSILFGNETKMFNIQQYPESVGDKFRCGESPVLAGGGCLLLSSSIW